MNLTTTETDPDVESAGQAPGWLRDSVILDEFVLEGSLGSGGMGEVHRFRDLLTDRCYAVKRARIAGDGPRRRLLQELQTWLELPSHPNLHPLLFIRSVADELVLFTDVAEGGNLAHWLQVDRGLPEVVGVALQLASGLAVAHNAQVVHQDIKPANILMTREGDVLLSDFGIARICGAIRGGSEAQAPYAGRTLAYCSPEQYARQTLGTASDVWSFGLVLLEMLLKRRTWSLGAEADAALAGLDPRVPAPLAAVVRRCLRRDPAQRWPHAGELFDRLVAACGALRLPTSVATRPSVSRTAIARLESGLRRLEVPRNASGMAERLQDGEEPTRSPYLQRALELLGLPPVADELTLLSVTRRASMAAALHRYDHAAALMARRPGERDSGAWRFVYAGLLAEKARIHLDLGDVSGACRSFARSAALWEPLVRDSQETDAMGAWLSACMMHVVLLIRSRQAEAALREIDRVVATMRTLPPGAHVHAIDFINLKATAEVELGQLEAALASYGRSVHGQQLLIEKMRAAAGAAGESRALLQDICGVAERVLAATLMNVACVLDDLHRVDESIEIQRAVVASREAHAEESPTIAHLRDLAISLLNLALTYKRSGDLDMAHEMMHESIAVYREMLGDRPEMTVDGLNFPRDVWFEYCDALVIHGSLYADSAEYSRAVELFAEAVPVYEHFVFVEGHLDRVDRLALTYAGQAEVLASAGRRDESRAMFERAATIQRRLLAAQPGRAAERLAVLHHKWRLRLGPSASRSDEAVRLLEQQVRKHGREDLAGELARAHIARYDDHGPGAHGERSIDCALQLLSRWNDDDIPDSYLTALFEALARKGTLLALRDEHAGAIAWYDRALRLAKRRPIPADRAIGVVVSNRAYALGQQGEWIDSGIGYTQAADLFEPLYAQRPDVEGFSLLIEALNCAAFAWARKRTRRRVRKLAERALRVFDTASTELQAGLSTETRERLDYWRKKVPELPSHDDRPVGGFEMMVAAVPGHPVANAVQSLILTFSWSQKQALIRSQWAAFTHPGVLPAFVLLGEAGQGASPDAAAKLREMLRLNLGLVQACKSHGIEETFASAAVRGQFQAAGLFSA